MADRMNKPISLFSVSLVALILLLSAKSEAQSPTPASKDTIDVEVDPRPLVNIGDLIQYPSEAKKAGSEGRVVAAALIEVDGSVSKVKIEKSAGPLFDTAARNALMQVRFSPAIQNGKPVRIWYTVPIQFKLTAIGKPPSSEDADKRNAISHPGFHF